jgi:hypothetical protein
MIAFSETLYWDVVLRTDHYQLAHGLNRWRRARW